MSRRSRRASRSFRPMAPASGRAKRRWRSTPRDLNAVIIRPPAVYGPGDRGTLPLITRTDTAHRRHSGPARCALLADPCARSGPYHRWQRRRAGAGHPRGERRQARRIWLAGLIAGCGGDARCARSGRCSCRARFRWRWRSALRRWRGFTGKPGMVNRGKVAELYHPDWVCREGTLALADPVGFAAGLCRDRGMVPRGRMVASGLPCR